MSLQRVLYEYPITLIGTRVVQTGRSVPYFGKIWDTQTLPLGAEVKRSVITLFIFWPTRLAFRLRSDAENDITSFLPSLRNQRTLPNQSGPHTRNAQPPGNAQPPVMPTHPVKFTTHPVKNTAFCHPPVFCHTR